MAVAYENGQLGFAIPFEELMAGGTAAMNARLDQMVDAGGDFIRADMRMDGIKTSTGYNWSQFDTFVNAADAKGLEVISLINSFGNLSTSTGRTAVADFAGTAAARYGTKIDAWEFGNEQNMAGITPANYTAALKLVYPAIKAVDSTDTVITGGTASVPSNQGSLYGANYYLQQIYANGGKAYFDAVAHHPYDYPYTPANSPSWGGTTMMQNDLRATMAANGDSGKDIWITEMGAPSAGGGAAVGEAGQAATVQQIYDIAHASDWAGPVLWYSLKDRGGSTSNTENWFGLLRPDGSAKPAWNTFDTIASADGDGATTPPPVDPDPEPDPTPEPPPPAGDQPTFTTANFVGTSANETIIGNSLDNVIDGQYGNDVIKGGAGADKIIGNVGGDTMYGGAGNDKFDFNLYSQFGSQSNPDKIMDFATGDKIDLYDLDANANLAGNQAFTFIGGNWLSNAGDLGVYKDTGANITYVQGDTNGDGQFDFSVQVMGLPTLTASSFVL